MTGTVWGRRWLEISHRVKSLSVWLKRMISDPLIPSNRVALSWRRSRPVCRDPVKVMTKRRYIGVMPRAVKEAAKYCTPNVIDAKNQLLTACEPTDYGRQPTPGAAYLHYCPNETIDGIAIDDTPNFGDDVIVTADFSSTILSREIDVNRYGVIYAGAQKNIGPAGLTLVIVREDLLGKASVACPSILDYTVLNANDSMFNTPPTFAWYLAGLVFKWLKEQGGVAAMDKINQQKAELLYGVIDNSDFYRNDVAAANRSRMNVPFQLADSALDKLFLEESFAAGLHALKGHRVVGGMRASIYNAMPLAGVKEATDFMQDFERRRG